ncbi:MAG: hypothetical protein ACYTBV_14840 [Planctomycetota bacterium]
MLKKGINREKSILRHAALRGELSVVDPEIEAVDLRNDLRCGRPRIIKRRRFCLRETVRQTLFEKLT